jgi:hypothetical protein
VCVCVCVCVRACVRVRVRVCVCGVRVCTRRACVCARVVRVRVCVCCVSCVCLHACKATCPTTFCLGAPPRTDWLPCRRREPSQHGHPYRRPDHPWLVIVQPDRAPLNGAHTHAQVPNPTPTHDTHATSQPLDSARLLTADCERPGGKAFCSLLQDRSRACWPSHAGQTRQPPHPPSSIRPRRRRSYAYLPRAFSVFSLLWTP